MNVMLLLEMAAGAAGDRLALGERADGLSYGRLFDLAGRAVAEFRCSGSSESCTSPSRRRRCRWRCSARRGPASLCPLNYRLADDRLRLIVDAKFRRSCYAMAGLSIDLRVSPV